MNNKIKAKHVKRFEALASRMQALLEEIREYCPEANLYQECDNWNLMSGPSHTDDHACKQLQGNVVVSIYMPHTDGGAW